MDTRVLNLEHYWMPFTDNRRFKAKPKLVTAAKDMYFTTAEGTQVLDGLATLWCVNAGHSRARIVEAIRRQAVQLDFAASFSVGHPLAFQLAERIAAGVWAIAPSGHPRFSRQAAPRTVVAVAASAWRCAGVPLLDSSPAVRSHRPTRCPAAVCSAMVPPSPISRSSDSDRRPRPEGGWRRSRRRAASTRCRRRSARASRLAAAP